MIRKSLIFTIVMLYFSISGLAQLDRILSRDSTWRSNGIFSLNIGQTSFTNWAAGGENQININSILHYRLRYNKGSSSWENMIIAKYGVLLFSNMNTKKTDDKIDFTSKYGYKASKKWNYSYYLSFNSQFYKGYKYPNDSTMISDFMAPGYFMAGIGMDFIPVKAISFLISPLTYKVTIVNDARLANDGNFGVEEAIRDTAGNIIVAAQRFVNEPGSFIKIYYQNEFKNGLTISSKIGFFTAFSHEPENIDINWATFITYKISKRFSATFSLDLVYDDDIIIKEDTNGDGVKEELGPRLQAKQTFGIGISIRM